MPLRRPDQVEGTLATYRACGRSRPTDHLPERDLSIRAAQTMQPHPAVVRDDVFVVAGSEHVNLLTLFDQLRREGGVQSPDSPLIGREGRVFSREDRETQASD